MTSLVTSLTQRRRSPRRVAPEVLDAPPQQEAEPKTDSLLLVTTLMPYTHERV